ncbi:putative endonuclease [Gordonia malaquae]|nr:GIY-YIG nuclease family protein [Gordonia malaquae]SEE01939.1 putative endonuclease [Gordonia malaquae]
MSAFVYILLCSDGTTYVGSTRDMDQRFMQHMSGKGCVYTSTRLPVELIFCQEYSNVGEAYAMERKLHGWGHKKRIALARSDWDAIRDAARCRNATRSDRPDRL